MKKVVYGIAILFLALCSCEPKELPKSVDDGEVLFYAEGSLSGETFFLSAGPNDIIVETDANLTEDELPDFEIQFINGDCEECDERLEIVITGADDYTENSLVEDILPLDAYELNPFPELEFVDGNFVVDFDDFNATIFDFQGGEIITEPGTYSLAEGIYAYSIFSFGGPECGVNSTNTFFIDENGEVCLVQLYLEEDEDGLYFDFSDFNDVEEYQLLINQTDFTGFVVDERLYLDLFEDAFFPITEINITPISFDEDCLIFDVSYSFLLDIDPDCFPEIEVENTGEIINEIIPQSVSIRYTDADGVVYESSDPHVDDSFIISDLELYEDDPLGREAYRALVAFSAHLINTSNSLDEILLDIEEAYIPVVFE